MGSDDWNFDRRPRKKTFHSGLFDFKFPTDRPEALPTVAAVIIGGLAFAVLIVVITMIIKSCNG